MSEENIKKDVQNPKNIEIKINAKSGKASGNLFKRNPVISNSGVGDVANIIKKYNVGILLDKLDRQSLRVAYQELIELMEDPELSSRCRNVAEMIYSLSEGINSYTQIYKSVLKN